MFLLLLRLLVLLMRWLVEGSLLYSCLVHGRLRLGWEGAGRPRCKGGQARYPPLPRCGLRKVGSPQLPCMRCTWVNKGLSCRWCWVCALGQRLGCLRRRVLPERLCRAKGSKGVGRLRRGRRSCKVGCAVVRCTCVGKWGKQW